MKYPNSFKNQEEFEYETQAKCQKFVFACEMTFGVSTNSKYNGFAYSSFCIHIKKPAKAQPSLPIL